MGVGAEKIVERAYGSLIRTLTVGLEGDFEKMVMACKNPFIKAPGGANTKDLKRSKEVRSATMPFGCGQCLPCRINKSREWMLRILLESYHCEDCAFVTLTYEDKKLTLNDHGVPQVDPNDLTLFFKKLRKEKKFRYFAVGEYGEGGRPHFHIMFFGLSELDMQLIADTWGMGGCYYGDLNPSTARYITGYCIKKLTKEGDEYLYGNKPEIMRSSKGGKEGNGGIGKPAIGKIAESYRKQANKKPRIIREFRIGKNLYPLGRYLTKTLANELGVSDLQWERELAEYQIRNFEELNEGRTDEVYKNWVIFKGRGKRQSMEAKFKIYKQRRSLHEKA